MQDITVTSINHLNDNKWFNNNNASKRSRNALKVSRRVESDFSSILDEIIVKQRRSTENAYNKEELRFNK